VYGPLDATPEDAERQLDRQARAAGDRDLVQRQQRVTRGIQITEQALTTAFETLSSLRDPMTEAAMSDGSDSQIEARRMRAALEPRSRGSTERSSRRSSRRSSPSLIRRSS
jgi:hypothetical protein